MENKKSIKEEEINKLILGDCLDVLKSIKSNSVDLIYLDPPFFSNKKYEIIWGDKGEIRSFEDRFAGGMKHYIGWLKDRVVEMHRVLKDTGSIYLHCDHHANAYIRVMILDEIFGYKKFRNEIIWSYCGGGASKKRWSRKHDVIFYYTKSKDWIFNTDIARISYPKDSQAWKALKSSKQLYKKIGNKKYDWNPHEKGKIPEDVWQMSFIGPISKERIGYPTQKPEKLLERIIKASSNEGDIVIDPFIGGGTTIAVAEKLNRRWIGIDQSVQAIKVSEMRLRKNENFFSKKFSLKLLKYDYDELRNMDSLEFEKWIIVKFGGVPNEKQSGDSGIDGKKGNIPIQVKRQDSVGLEIVDRFLSSIRRFDLKMFHKAKELGIVMGYIIGFSFSKIAIEEVARLKIKENIRIELLKVEDIVPVSKKPKLIVLTEFLKKPDKGLQEVELKAKGISDIGIEFYSWDWDYNEKSGFKACIYKDEDGIQRHSFKSGNHTIGVKCIDSDGFDCIKVVNLMINGVVGE